MYVIVYILNYLSIGVAVAEMSLQVFINVDGKKGPAQNMPRHVTLYSVYSIGPL